MIKKLLSPEVQKFIKDHQDDDPFLLSLNAKREEDFPLSEAIVQIQSRQKAKGKLSSWLEMEGLVFPHPVSVEQSSSEITARYKASLVHGKSLVDLTGGMGVDTFFFADQFKKVIYVESYAELCDLARHNFMLFEKNVDVRQSTAEHFLNENKAHFDAFFIDPSRRVDERKVFKLKDCVPNIYKILPICLQQSVQVLIKLSPLVDLALLIDDFRPSDIWVVAVKGEVKEVLCLIKKEKNLVKIHAVDLSTDEKKAIFEFEWEEEAVVESMFSKPLKYLYEPNASILKSGAFKLIGQGYGLGKLHQHTHLYTSDKKIEKFPGKVLEFREIVKQNKKEIERLFPYKKVNVITRNFPMSASQLKKKFGLKDGGDDFLIGTTLMDGKKVLLWCERLV